VALIAAPPSPQAAVAGLPAMPVPAIVAVRHLSGAPPIAPPAGYAAGLIGELVRGRLPVRVVDALNCAGQESR
jgi:hypothetical protein